MWKKMQENILIIPEQGKTCKQETKGANQNEKTNNFISNLKSSVRQKTS